MIPVIINPINPSTTAPAVGITALGISSNAPQVPPNISSIPAGSFLQGFVLNRDGSGNPVLRTDQGDFSLQSSLFLKIGSSVLVRIDASGSNFRAHITEVDGQKVNADTKPTTTTNQQKSGNDQIVRSGWIPSADNNTSASKSAELNAILLTPNSAATAAQLKVGTALLVRLFNIQLPSSNHQATTSQSPATSGNATPTATQNTSTQNTAGNPTQTSVANNPLPTTNAAAQTPTATSNAPLNAYQATTQTGSNTTNPTPTTILLPNANPQNTAAQTIPTQAMLLTVIGQERDGEPVLQTPFGLIKITSNVTLATGTQVQATLANANTAGSSTVLQSPENAASLASLTQKWPSLSQILNILTEANEGVLPTQLASLLPQIQLSPTQVQVNNNGGAGLFMFMAALQGGDFRSVLGEKSIKQLEKLGHTSLLNKAEGEFQALSKLATSAPQQGWQTMFLPMLVEGQVEMMRWFTKREQEKDKDGKRRIDAVTRFIVEVSMSQLGDIQLDGFFKIQEQATNQFELIVRSHQPLDANVQRDIQAIYQEAQQITGVSGSVVFQASEHFPTLPLEDILGNPPDVFA